MYLWVNHKQCRITARHVLVIVSGEGSWETTDRVEMLSSVLGGIVAMCNA